MLNFERASGTAKWVLMTIFGPILWIRGFFNLFLEYSKILVVPIQKHNALIKLGKQTNKNAFYSGHPIRFMLLNLGNRPK